MERVYIKKKTEWINSIRLGETKTGYFKDRQDLNTVCTLISRYNMTIGLTRGWRIRGSRNWQEKNYTITCIKIEDDANTY